jgi:lysophospholipase L1-like esterase|tara:strand:+ start:573 stop:1292 length:720 start_codon:yes stop_codon:yes gene_type:complete
MKKHAPLIFLVGFALFSYGVVVGKYDVFPYQFIKMVKNITVPVENTTVPVENQNNPRWINAVRLFEHFSPKADVAFVGDSITNAGRWNEFFPSLKVVNRGISGDIASDILLRIDSILSTEPSKVFIMVGINDIHRSLSVSKILENYELIVNALMESNVEVVIQSTIQCEVSVCGVQRVASVNELNNGLKQLAIKNGAKFHSLGDLSDSSGLNSKYTSDGIHLTAKGYIYWVGRLEPLLD